MPADEVVKLTETTKDALTEYRDEHDHTSYDSAVRELVTFAQITNSLIEHEEELVEEVREDG